MIKVNVNKPKTRRGLKTFDKLCVSAEKLFHEKTYHGATINDIVEDAGFGVGTFYIYFESKQVLYRYLVCNYYHDIRKCMADHTRNCKTRLEFEEYGLRAFIDYVIKNPHAYTIIWQSLLVDRDLFIDYYTSFASRYIVQLNKSIQEGEINPNIDTTALAYALMGISNYIGLETIVFHKRVLDDASIDKMVKTVMIMLAQGIQPKEKIAAK